MAACQSEANHAGESLHMTIVKFGRPACSYIKCLSPIAGMRTSCHGVEPYRSGVRDGNHD